MTEHETPREPASSQPPRPGGAAVALAWRRVLRSLAGSGRRNPSDLRDGGDGDGGSSAQDGDIWLHIARGLTCLNDPRTHEEPPRD